MCETLAEVRLAAEALASRFDARLLSAADASRMLTDANALKNIAATIEAMLSDRVAECGRWRGDGSKSPADYIAKRTGVSVGQAADLLRTAEQLRELPAVAEAARRGELSPQQVSAVTSAAAVAPAEQSRLLGEAKRLPLKDLKDECGRTRAAHTDAEAQRRRIRDERYCSTWNDPDGSGHLHARGPAEDIAAIAARINAERDRIFETARNEGRQESPAAYAFDALKNICLGEAASGKVDAKVIWRVDLEAFLRGYATDGETCDVAGCPVAVSAVEDLLQSGSPFLAALITKGEAITGVLHFGRAPTARQQTGLEWLYPTCAAEGCSQSAHLQRDHREDWAKTKVTIFDLLDLLCPFHHGLKTTKGYGLVEGRGKRAFVAPDDVRHPQHSPPDAA
ncbi:MAG: hypothetical protein QOG87_4295 [Actinomycetota bacterium]|jgi:hypothetical protein